MTFRVVSTDDERGMASLEYVIRLLTTPEHPFEWIKLGDLAKRLDRPSRQHEKKFQHTPEPLLDSWRAARRLTELTDPGDVVLMSDHRGLGGIFALDQATAEKGQRRQLWTVAADSGFLELRLVAATHEGMPMPLDSQVDWEIVQYQWSDRVISTSMRALHELASIRVGAELVGQTQEVVPGRRTLDPTRIWAPGAVSRRNQSGVILRGLTSIAGASITLSDLDREDGIWSGSAWDALRHSRDVLEGRVNRDSTLPSAPTAIIIGDPFAPPGREIAELRATGVPLLVPQGSVAQMVWPDASAWTDADDLSRLFGAESPVTSVADRPAAPIAESLIPVGPSEVLTVSVGIPVFRDVRFLTECVDSILGQDLGPQEIVLIDDGSNAAEVDAAFADLKSRDPRIHTMATQHRGVCAARNAALQRMIGQAFVFIDSDDILEPSFLFRCAEVLRSLNDVWAVATWTEFFGDYEGVEAKPPFDERVGLRENPIISTAVLVDMKVRDMGIRFADDLAFLYCEDWHFWSQIVAAGGRFGLVPQPLAKHRVHPSSGGYLRTELAHAVGRSRATEPMRRLRA
jgi:GT2 family glycosyltransferase